MQLRRNGFFPPSTEASNLVKIYTKVCFCIYAIAEEGNSDSARLGRTNFGRSTCYTCWGIEHEELCTKYTKKTPPGLTLAHTHTQATQTTDSVQLAPKRFHWPNTMPTSLSATRSQINQHASNYQRQKHGEIKNSKNMLERPYNVYADAECSLLWNDDANKVVTHVASSACSFFVCASYHTTT